MEESSRAWVKLDCEYKGTCQPVVIEPQGSEEANGWVAAVAAFGFYCTQEMPPLSKFKRFDVRPLLERGTEPLPEILKRVQTIQPQEGLIIIAPFLPSPLIELLGGQGFASKVERGGGGGWIVYCWHGTV